MMGTGSIKNRVIKSWTTDEGYKAVIRHLFFPVSSSMLDSLAPSEWLCGYVGVPETHPLYRKTYYDLDDIDVHGGLTFSDFSSWDEEDVWYFGFDCAHPWDSILVKNEKFVIKQCQSLSKQLKSREFNPEETEQDGHL